MNSLDRIELAGGIDYFEDTFKIRAQWRASDLAGAKRMGERLPISALNNLIQAQAAEFLLWLSLQSPAKRDRILDEIAPKLELFARLRQENYERAMKQIKAHRQSTHQKTNGNGHAH